LDAWIALFQLHQEFWASLAALLYFWSAAIVIGTPPASNPQALTGEVATAAKHSTPQPALARA
jgi:hypothetical protein